MTIINWKNNWSILKLNYQDIFLKIIYMNYIMTIKYTGYAMLDVCRNHKERRIIWSLLLFDYLILVSDNLSICVAPCTTVKFALTWVSKLFQPIPAPRMNSDLCMIPRYSRFLVPLFPQGTLLLSFYLTLFLKSLFTFICIYLGTYIVNTEGLC